jgi:hypothetical protein
MMALQCFTATFSAPGFYETETIHADDQAAAEARAAEIAQEPYVGWPPRGMCSRMKITVKPAITPVLKPQAAE